jgi:hypothetical protein
MREYGTRQVEATTLTALSCDKCGRDLLEDKMEYQEAMFHDADCGYSSVFGDEATIKIDLCQHCIKELLGEWISIS